MRHQQLNSFQVEPDDCVLSITYKIDRIKHETINRN